MNLSGAIESLAATGVVEAALLVWFLLAAAFLGDLLVRRLVPPDTEHVERLAFSAAVGLGFLGLATLLLGALGLLYGWLFKSLFGILSIYCLWRLLARGGHFSLAPRSDWKSNRRRPERAVEPSDSQEPSDRPTALVSWIAAGFVLFTLALALVAALGPETEFDALNHHLGTVRLFLTAKRIGQTPSMAWAAHPLLVEMLYAFAWLVGDQLLAKLVHFGLGFLTAAACYLFCRHYLSRAAGWLSAAVFLGSPIVLYLMQAAYIDLGLAFFGFLSTWSFYNWLRSSHRGWLVLSALLGGLCLGTKYFGAVVPLSLAGYLIWTFVRNRSRGVAQVSSEGDKGDAARSLPDVPSGALIHLVAFVAITFLLFSPWLVKNFLLFGNPVAPFLADRIPTSFLTGEDYRQLSALTASWGGLQGGLLDYLRSPWLLTMKPELFVGSIGPLFLIFLPLAVIFGFRNRTLRYLGFCALVEYGLLLVATRNVRYFVVVLPLLSVLVAGALFPGRSVSRLRSGLGFVMLLVCFLQLPWFVRLWEDHPALVVSPAKFRLLLSGKERNEQLDRWLGEGSAQLYEFLDRRIPEGGRVLALTPLYQALTDRTVIMAPNSSMSSRLSLQAIDAARVAAGMRIVEIQAGDEGHGVKARLWRIRATGRRAASELDPVVRFFYVDSSPLEIPVFDRRLTRSSEELAVAADLGTERRVDRVRRLVTSGCHNRSHRPRVVRRVRSV